MARFDKGWIKVYRSILENPVATRNVFTLGIFVRILMMANRKESSAVFKGQKITVQPGQLLTGLRELSPDVDEDPYLHKIRNTLSYLVLCEAIEQVTSNQGRLLTVRNWSIYQLGDTIAATTQASEEQEARKQCASDAQLSGEGKKGRSKKQGIRTEYPPEFERLWESYGKLGDKKDALDALTSLNLSAEERENLSKAITNYLADCKKQDRFAKHFATFLRSDWREWISPRHRAAPPLRTSLEDLNAS